ncbi:molybdopterin-binding protein [Oceaniglobus trochenteri]|uniref:molybdopterin-binding protein n=1 Tax=Oceaniglobus trochenteri TaxID=2763260 RepID=UPI001CFFD9F5
MTGYDTIAIVDWSAGNDTGATPRKDAIWAGVVRGGIAAPPVYLRNRDLAHSWLTALAQGEIAAGRRLLLGFDFPFGYPDGFGHRLCGTDDPLALWDWFAEALHDRPQGNDRFALAGRINAMFSGTGPFWFNGTKTDIPGLPRKDSREGHGMTERRAADSAATGAFTCWQMGGAGAVGGQAMTGMAALSRLRATLGDRVAVWPFQPLTAPVALVEVWPSLIARVVRDRQHSDEIRDAAQVRVLAESLWQAQQDGTLEPMLNDVPPAARASEGWILGLGHETALAAPTLRNDCFALPPGVTWTPVDDALALLRDRLRPVVRRETLATERADGRILARDHAAARSNPPGANAAVDGYGFAHATLSPGAQRLPLVAGRSAAGAPLKATVPPGHALRILTGALIPEGVDTVVLQEDCTVADGHVSLPALPKVGANTRKAGEDVTMGAPALPAMHRLRPPDLALLSAVGLAQVDVFAQLRVGVLSTGDELVAPGTSADPARTYDANRPMLLALAARWGHAPVDLGHVGDDRAALRDRLNAARETTDVVLTSGGASAGEEDHVSALLAEAGAMQAWRIALKPGRPLALGMWDGMPVFGLPGNPVAALVCALIFARPALSRLAGGDWVAPVAFDVPAGFAKRKKAGRREYLRARLRDGRAEPFASEGSGRISGLSWAEGLIELPDGAAEIAPGDMVRFLPYGGFGF